MSFTRPDHQLRRIVISLTLGSVLVGAMYMLWFKHSPPAVRHAQTHFITYVGVLDAYTRHDWWVTDPKGKYPGEEIRIRSHEAGPGLEMTIALTFVIAISEIVIYHRLNRHPKRSDIPTSQ